MVSYPTDSQLATGSCKLFVAAVDRHDPLVQITVCAFAEEFLNVGKKVYLVELKDKDPSEMGFIDFTKLVQTSKKLTYENLFEKKLSLI